VTGEKTEERPVRRNKNMRIMGLDYGSKTVGVAVCDPLGITAQAVETITRKDENKLRKTLARIEELIDEYQIERIVLGYPKNMNNTLGERALKTEELKASLERRTGLPVVLWDERLTTVAAERVLMESGVRREHRKESVDQIAAAMILQGYLDSLGNAGELHEEQ
jgi:putative Holliday junction resolvase